jgi:hypothetical protein
MTSAVLLTFPRPGGPLPSANHRLHHHALTKKLAPWVSGVRAAWLELPPAERAAVQSRRCAVQVTIPVPDRRRRDPHNYVAPLVKALVDALVRAGVWPDDDPEWVTVLEPIFAVSRTAPVSVELRVVEAGTCPLCGHAAA